MNIIHVICDGNKLKMNGNSFSTSGSINNDIVKFKFSSDWDGLAKKAVFWKWESQVQEILVDENDQAYIPPEVLLSDGELKFGVYGYNEETPIRIPSTVLTMCVVEGAYKEGSESSVELTPSELEQVEIMLAKTQEMQEELKQLIKDGNVVAGTCECNLPKATSDDSGKFLRVDNTGAWVLETLSNAEEVAY